MLQQIHKVHCRQLLDPACAQQCLQLLGLALPWCQGQGNSVGPEEMPKGHKCTAGEHSLSVGHTRGAKAVPVLVSVGRFFYPESVN